MIRRLAIAVLACAAICAAWAQEAAFTNRPTELKDRGAADARTVATLPENASVKVLARGGGWTRVESGGQSGWVRAFHLRFAASVEATSSSSPGGTVLSSVTSVLGFGKPTAREANIASTGVRGLSPEDLKNANPDPEALKRMQSFRAEKGAAEGFAREGKLSANTIDYPDGGRR